MREKNEQEAFWEGNFGKEYTIRNTLSGQNVSSAINAFSTILNRTEKVSSFLEFGCNCGRNLTALQHLMPQSRLSGVEINAFAVEELKKNPVFEVFHQSIQNFSSEQKWDFVFTFGVLIHIAPEDLELIYDKMYNHSAKYILMAEYYNPNPVTIPYRGYTQRLFKRDFAGEMMERHPDLKLIDYGFFYHRDPNFPQDDITWFLMEKKA